MALERHQKVFLSIEDKDSLKPKLDYIVDNGLGGMMIWEMAGDYSYDAVKREYVIGSDMTSYAMKCCRGEADGYSS